MKVRSFLTGLVMLFSIAVFAGSDVTNSNANNKATVKEKVATMTQAQKDARMIEIKDRIGEIKAMDKSQLSSSERKELRHEMRDLKHEARYVTGRSAAIAILGGALVGAILILALA